MIKFKFLISSFFLLFLAINTQAQSSLTEAENFMAKDTDGQTHYLFDILDEGQIVVLTFFTTT